MRGLATRRLKTPARLGDLVVWGDFRPETPVVERPEEGEAFVVQAAAFVCRWAGDVARGTVMQVAGEDWTVESVSQDADGAVVIRLERVQG